MNGKSCFYSRREMFKPRQSSTQMIPRGGLHSQEVLSSYNTPGSWPNTHTSHSLPAIYENECILLKKERCRFEIFWLEQSNPALKQLEYLKQNIVDVCNWNYYWQYFPSFMLIEHDIQNINLSLRQALRHSSYNWLSRLELFCGKLKMSESWISFLIF